MISLRPRGEHASLRRAAARHGAGLIALSPWRVRPRNDATTRAALSVALSAPLVVATSPVAVRAAQALSPLREAAGQWFAVGAGTALALRRAGVGQVHAPSRMDSEGLLALPGLQELQGEDIGFVSAPGGRGLLVPALQARGARVLRADVYDREAVAPSPQSIVQLSQTTRPIALALSSGEALQLALAALPAPALARLRQARVLAASERLAAMARELGFTDIAVARGPRPADLLAAR